MLGLMLMLAGVVSAQYSTVTGTITDSNGTPYYLGHLTITFVNTTGFPAVFNGNSSFQTSYSAQLDSTGSFSISLPRNDATYMNPTGTLWNFQVTAKDGGSGFNTSISITAPSQSVSIALSAAAPRITFQSGGANAPPCAPNQSVVSVGILRGCGNAYPPLLESFSQSVDVFQRTAANLGSNWTDYDNTFSATGTAAKGGASGLSNSSAYTANPASSVEFPTITVASVNGTTDFVGLNMRLQGTPHSSSSYYRCVMNTTTMVLQKFTGQNDAGGGTQVWSYSVAITGAAGDQLQGRAIGQTIECYHNKNVNASYQVLEVADNTAPLSGGYAGLEQLGNVATIGSFTTRNPTPPAGTQVFIAGDGDSILNGAFVNSSFTDSLFVKSGKVAYVTNFGVDGKAMGVTSGAATAGNIESMITTGTTVIDTFYQPGLINILIVWGCHNDLIGSRTPAQCIADLTTYIAARHATGWKVVYIPLLSSSSNDAQMSTFNALLGTTATTTTGADQIVSLPPALTSMGSYANTTLFNPADGIHPTQFSQTSMIAPAVTAAINQLF